MFQEMSLSFNVLAVTIFFGEFYVLMSVVNCLMSRKTHEIGRVFSFFMSFRKRRLSASGRTLSYCLRLKRKSFNCRIIILFKREN